jgi:hypothetical protein
MPADTIGGFVVSLRASTFHAPLSKNPQIGIGDFARLG